MTLKIIVFFLFSICTTQLFGQYILETPDGKKVNLNSNGTWKFIKSDSIKKSYPKIPKNSTAKYISHFKKYELWYDPKEWIIDTTKTSSGYAN
jgi:hypothetical protein